LKSLVVDTSVLIAILNKEPEARLFATTCHAAETLFVSVATLHEAHCVAVRRRMEDGPARLDELAGRLELISVPFDRPQLAAARVGYAKYGRGTGHPANLNMGDCFAYALAATRDLPLLFKGDDFVHTDVRPALTPA